MVKKTSLSVILLGAALVASAAVTHAARPNVILVMTDDQGYGDLGCHGNPILKTPEIDKLHDEGIRFTDFHVSPFCTPSRASLMTGHHAGRSGAFRTTGGRSAMHPDEQTVANLFADHGYATGMMGKWHLGDNAPHRPQDRGFQDVVWHRCGGIGQGSDYWGNDYFDDVYERVTPGSRIGEFEQFEGYCTDVFFREGMRFIEANQETPFFLYLSLNAPHGPYRVPAEWAQPYKIPEVYNPNFYGMIANIDYNMGILRRKLDELGLAENTILIFMTDNGTSAGAKFNGLESEAVKGYNAGMRGKKSSIYEGGHRVPFFIYWPKGELQGGSDIDTLTAHIDVLPTLAELCGISVPADYAPDGLSVVPLLNESNEPWSRDHLILQFHGGAYGRNPLDKPFADTVVMTEQWRLTNSKKLELHDIVADPSQREDVSADYPEVVERLRALYDPFWESVSPRLVEPARIDIGNLDQNPTELCSQDWYMKSGYPPYSFGQIGKLPRVVAPWRVEVKRPGRYRFTLRQWPDAANKPVIAVSAKVEIAGQTQSGPVVSGCKAIVIEMDLPAGPAELLTYLYDEQGKAGGAYFTDVEWLGASDSLPEASAVLQSVGRVSVVAKKTSAARVNPKAAAFDFKSLKDQTSWTTDAFSDASKTIWDGTDLSGKTLTFSGNNFGYHDSMKAVDFSGSTIHTTGNQPFLFVDLSGADFSGAILNLEGSSGKMAAFRDANLAGANFSNITWGGSTNGLTEKTEYFFSGGSGATTAADKDLAVTFEGADLSRITGAAKAAMIQNLGKFDGTTAIGAKYDDSTLTKSGWAAAELDAAGWQRVR
ncbi:MULTISPECIES: sulfatase-like hydrolase/transferase [unclassified Lentimonas]|uniref:sulfatase-like hydrolase/transferase n=1 Tax=unclassified Lentimonas TaxID=2630993 RepID=UPI001323AB78|nr:MULTISPECIES: sulfatase-like hydrolase/transferase [unclassified Lentimonas]CAA6691742.1 Unannotated [Lentimonas sp. CC19]CAA6696106.1 Unannotated [Lentimonas sp. CC10]CAA7070093.1 Unannotated [Lentimonas sp. CC11]